MMASLSHTPTSFDFTQAGGIQGINPAPRQLPHGTPGDAPAIVVYGQSQLSDALQSAGNAEFHTTNINIMGTIAPSREARELGMGHTVSEGDLVIVYNPILGTKHSTNSKRGIAIPRQNHHPDTQPGALIMPQTWSHTGQSLQSASNCWPPAISGILISDPTDPNRDSTYDRNPSLRYMKKLDEDRGHGSDDDTSCNVQYMIHVVRSFSTVNPGGTNMRAPGSAKLSVSIRGRANLRIHPYNMQFLLNIGLYEGQGLLIVPLHIEANPLITLLVLPEGIDIKALYNTNPNWFEPMYKLLKKTYVAWGSPNAFVAALHESYKIMAIFASPTMFLQAAVVPERQILEVNITRHAYPIPEFDKRPPSPKPEPRRTRRRKTSETSVLSGEDKRSTPAADGVDKEPSSTGKTSKHASDVSKTGVSTTKIINNKEKPPVPYKPPNLNYLSTARESGTTFVGNVLKTSENRLTKLAERRASAATPGVGVTNTDADSMETVD